MTIPDMRSHLLSADDMNWLVAHEPANTVTKKKAIRHYNQRRCLTLLEWKLLQEFSPQFTLVGTYQQKCDQIGNAVPRLLARAVATSIMTAFRQAWELEGSPVWETVFEMHKENMQIGKHPTQLSVHPFACRSRQGSPPA